MVSAVSTAIREYIQHGVITHNNEPLSPERETVFNLACEVSDDYQTFLENRELKWASEALSRSVDKLIVYLSHDDIELARDAHAALMTIFRIQIPMSIQSWRGELRLRMIRR